MTQELKKFMSKNIARILILLVILTFGFSMRTAVMAKYNVYLNDMTSAVAGDFVFKSNYLYPEGETHEISSFDGKKYDIDLEFKAYENSLKYNASGTDVLFTVEAQAYRDASFTTLDTRVVVNVEYGMSDIYVAAIRPSDGQKYTVLRGLSDLAETNYSDALSAGEGKQNVSVHLRSDSGIFEDVTYLKVTAKTLPLAEMQELLKNPNFLQNGYSITTTRGIYYEELSAVFKLKNEISDSTFTADIIPGDLGKVTYRLFCKDTSGASSVPVKVFYDDSILTPESDDYKKYYNYATTPFEWTDSSGVHHSSHNYLALSCDTGGGVVLTFNKASYSVDNSKLAGAIQYTQAYESVDDENAKFSVGVATGTNGTVRVGLPSTQTDFVYTTVAAGSQMTDKVKNQTEMRVEVTAPTGYIVGNIGITRNNSASVEVPIISTNVDGSKMTISFRMPNDDFTITPNYIHKVKIDTNLATAGNIVLDFDGREPGEPINITVLINDHADEAKEYYVESIKLNTTELASADGIYYSFNMPTGEATLSVVFGERDKIAVGSGTNL